VAIIAGNFELAEYIKNHREADIGKQNIYRHWKEVICVLRCCKDVKCDSMWDVTTGLMTVFQGYLKNNFSLKNEGGEKAEMFSKYVLQM